jgi:hypothetical protein
MVAPKKWRQFDGMDVAWIKKRTIGVAHGYSTVIGQQHQRMTPWAELRPRVG